MRKILLSLLFLIIACGIVFAEELPVVNSIEIKGLKRIEEGAVKSKISQKIGGPISQDKTNEDIKTIYNMGYFDDVKAEIEAFEGGVKLIYFVKEKPTITAVELQGNKEIEESKIREKITIKSGAIADTVLIQDNAVKIRNFYEEEGYWLSNVVPVLKKISEDEVNLTYQIDEGTKVKIKNIIIDGNKNISGRKIKKVMETGEWGIFSFLTSTGYFKKDRMENDILKIKGLYFDNGFIKVAIAEPEINLDTNKKNMTITIRIAEGDQFKVSSIEFTGNKVYDDEILRKKITLTPGTVFSKTTIEKNINAVSSIYSESGYALVSVVPDLVTNDNNKTVQVLLKVEEGDKYRVGRIEVLGNTKTRDKVIRREIRFAEGETYDSAKVKRSYERINNLNFFEAVELLPKPKYENKTVDIDVKVKERATGFFSIGGGYSSIDKFILTADITQGNLFGKGQYIKLKGELSGRSSLYELSFRDPWFMDKPISFSTGIYKTNRDFIDYSKKALGFYMGFGKNLSEYWRGDITYNFESATIYNVGESVEDCKKKCDQSDTDCLNKCEENGEPPAIIKDQVGKKITSSISPSIVRDTRDNYLDTTRGSRNSLSMTFAGLGGSNAFIKGLVDSGWYFPWGDTTFMFRGRFGYAQGIFGKELPLYERFYVGGLYTVRGLGLGEAGPREIKKNGESGDPIGGTRELIFNTEYIFPIFPEAKFKGLVFFDAGNSADSFSKLTKLRYTSGLGFRWISPVGPVRIEWGFNLQKKPDESSSKFEFGFGTFF
jgi:outer membrane protein insertion porin family